MVEVAFEFFVGTSVQERHGWADRIAVIINEYGCVHLGTETDTLDLVASNTVIFEEVFCATADGIPPLFGALFHPFAA